MHGLSGAQSDSTHAAAKPATKPAATTTATQKPSAHKSAAASAKSKHPAGTHSTAKRTTASTHSTAQSKKGSRGKKSVKQVAKTRGQQGIDSDRAREIQEALIREHYLQGAPSGAWDATTQAAMQRYQADQGWQSKTTPDSRALIKLGLGPSHDHLLNPESAMTMQAAKAGTADPKAPAPPPQDADPKN
jgi:predicted nucleic acid-binding protein